MDTVKFTLRLEHPETHELLRLLAGRWGVSMNRLAEDILQRGLRLGALLGRRPSRRRSSCFAATGPSARSTRTSPRSRAPRSKLTIQPTAGWPAPRRSPTRTGSPPPSPPDGADRSGRRPAGSASTIAGNIANVLADIAAAAGGRDAPTVAMGLEWHRRVHEGVALPVAHYAGNARDSDPASRTCSVTRSPS